MISTAYNSEHLMEAQLLSIVAVFVVSLRINDTSAESHRGANASLISTNNTEDSIDKTYQGKLIIN